jgi:hypothetical protein
VAGVSVHCSFEYIKLSIYIYLFNLKGLSKEPTNKIEWNKAHVTTEEK